MFYPSQFNLSKENSRVLNFSLSGISVSHSPRLHKIRTKRYFVIEITKMTKILVCSLPFKVKNIFLSPEMDHSGVVIFSPMTAVLAFCYLSAFLINRFTFSSFTKNRKPQIQPIKTKNASIAST